MTSASADKPQQLHRSNVFVSASVFSRIPGAEPRPGSCNLPVPDTRVSFLLWL